MRHAIAFDDSKGTTDERPRFYVHRILRPGTYIAKPIRSAGLETFDRPAAACSRNLDGEVEDNPGRLSNDDARLDHGCNQKSNRSPINNYSQEQIEESVDQLREIGALAIVQGNGRVSKVRHYGYQWLGINKVEAAVMTELLLRGEQTVGELRTRASRMEPIQDLGELQNILEGLRQKKLIISLTPPGRGQVVSHNLYQDHELDQLKQAVAAGVSTMPNDDEPAAPTTSRATSSYTSASSSSASSSTSITSELEELRKMVMKLNARVSYLEEQLGLNSASDSSPSE